MFDGIVPMYRDAFHEAKINFLSGVGKYVFSQWWILQTVFFDALNVGAFYMKNEFP
jgi:hypothetical protein